MSKFEFFPKENPELGDAWAVFWFLPFTGAHFFYMREKKRGAIRLGLLVLWILIPFIFTLTRPMEKYWIYAGIIFPALWIYDAVTLKRLFEKRWGKKLSLRI